MNGPQRYSAHGCIGAPADATLAPDADGPAVMFADVEESLRDSKRLAWLRPVIEGHVGDRVGDLRTQALHAGLTIGLKGNQLLDWAMEGCPI